MTENTETRSRKDKVETERDTSTDVRDKILFRVIDSLVAAVLQPLSLMSPTLEMWLVADAR